MEMFEPAFLARKHTLLNDPFSCYSLNISPHEDILRFEGKIPTYLQLKVYIIFFFPEPFMTFPPLKWGCYAAAV
jgi:hypothetical protein